MRLIIDDIHFADSEGSRWTLKAKSGRLRSAARTIRPLTIDCGSLPQLSDTLSYHGLMPQGGVRVGGKAGARAAGMEAGLKDADATAIAFGSGRFLIERGQGDWHLLNPTRDVARLSADKDRHGRRSIVGYFPSVRSALMAAVERVMQADPRTIPYADLDAAVTETAHALWADLHPTESNAASPLSKLR